MGERTLYAVSCGLTFVYGLMIFVLLGKFKELDPFSYFNIEYERVEAIVLTTTSFMVFSALLLYNYFYGQVMANDK